MPNSSGCPLEPALVRELLPRLGEAWVTPALLEAMAQQPEAAAYLMNEKQALTVGARLCQPPFPNYIDFGRVAAVQALSGIYAAGARPLASLALLSLPELDIPGHALSELEAGITACCQEAAVPLMGIHVMPGEELSCGLLTLGQLNPKNMAHGSLPRVGDRVVLGKPLGYGIYLAARQRGELHHHDLHEWLEVTGQANVSGPSLDCLDGVHQVLEVGDQGLWGCLQGLGQEGTSIRVDVADIPVLHRVHEFIGTADAAEYGRKLLADPQLNGGLLVVCAPESVTEVLSIFLQQGFGHASVVGEVVAAGPEPVLLA